MQEWTEVRCALAKAAHPIGSEIPVVEAIKCHGLGALDVRRRAMQGWAARNAAMTGETPDIPYRLYLRSAGRIVCRHELVAPSDAVAHHLAGLLAQAAADVCDSFEVWQGGRVVVWSETRLRADDGITTTEIRSLLLESADAILSGWPAGRSKRLAAQLAKWKAAPDAGRLERIVRDAVLATGADTGNIQLHDGAGNLRIVAQYRLDRDFLDFFAVVTPGETSCGLAMQIAERVIVADVAASPIFRGNESGAALLRAGLRSTYSTPILVRGSVGGMLSTHRTYNWRPGVEELARIDHFAAAAASVVE